MDDKTLREAIIGAIGDIDAERHVERDMARPELLVELVNNLPTIIEALKAKDL